ncbi:MAG: HAD-IC family P-type ATPase, partial [Candidatus Cloacimonetes bacterium]|nr:HAD-IC family P-type ATPase [Candidatus Cloacimonadota bacterium]
MKFSQYTTKNAKEVMALLQTSEGGLSEKEAKKRLSLYGFNEVQAKEAGGRAIFLRQFKSPFFYLLFAAAVIAFLINERMNGCLIFSFVVINLFLGFFQEARAQKAAVLLKKYLTSKARVLREGVKKEIEKSILVPGDLVFLKAGDIVPADIFLIKAKNFLLDESILSGESVAVPKSPQVLPEEAKEIFAAQNIVFSATAVVSGKAEGVVIGTGKDTAVGEIAKLVSAISRESVYEKNVLQFSRRVLKIVLTTIVLVFLLNLIIKGGSNFFDFLLFSLALVVSIIPEALPLVVSFALSNGALKLAKQKVIVKRLSAVEDLGDIEILCTDKTGTLTENRLELVDIHSVDKEKCLAFALFSDSSHTPFNDALLAAAPRKVRQALRKIKIISEIPFEPSRLKNSVLVDMPEEERILICKGAPEAILKESSLPAAEAKKLQQQIEEEGQKGRRVLAVAYKKFTANDFSEEDE